MEKKMKADYHMHSNFSNDSNYPMEDVVTDAIKMGLQEICFTDHVEYIPTKNNDDGISDIYTGNYDIYFETIKKLQSKYKNKISIKIGFEFGLRKEILNRFQELFEKYEVDFIILSVHRVNGLELWNHEFQEGKTEKQYTEQYFNEMLYYVENYKNYSVIGHMELLKRYDLNYDYPFEKIKLLITKIFKIIIADGKGIEINTSSFRYGMKDLLPSKDVLKLYRELGGKIITIGSDSHRAKDLATYIEETKPILKNLGFDEFCTFEKMKPIFHKM